MISIFDRRSGSLRRRPRLRLPNDYNETAKYCILNKCREVRVFQH